MGLVRGSIASLSLVVLVIACNTVDADQCWPNTSGGFGGSETLPIGAAVGAGSGDFASPPAGGLLDYGGDANPCIFTCVDDCEWEKKDCDKQCRKIPENKKREREACWSKCENEYAACLKKCKD